MAFKQLPQLRFTFHLPDPQARRPSALPVGARYHDDLPRRTQKLRKIRIPCALKIIDHKQRVAVLGKRPCRFHLAGKIIPRRLVRFTRTAVDAKLRIVRHRAADRVVILHIDNVRKLLPVIAHKFADNRAFSDSAHPRNKDQPFAAVAPVQERAALRLPSNDIPAGKNAAVAEKRRIQTGIFPDEFKLCDRLLHILIAVGPIRLQCIVKKYGQLMIETVLKARFPFPFVVLIKGLPTAVRCPRRTPKQQKK